MGVCFILLASARSGVITAAAVALTAASAIGAGIAAAAAAAGKDHQE